MIKPTSKPKRKSKKLNSSLTFEALEPRRVLALEIAGNDCPPDLDLSGVPSQTINVGESFSLNILESGGTVSDVDLSGNPTGDQIRFQLDPDVPEDTPTGIEITEDGVISWTPTASQVGSYRIIVIAIDSGEQPLADAEILNFEVTDGTTSNAAPSIDLNGAATGTGNSASFTEDGGAVGVASTDLGVTDADDVQLTSANVSITNLLDGNLEALAADTTGTAISAQYDSATGTLSLSGVDTVANYQQVLRTVTYNNTSDNPNLANRTIDFVVNDGEVDSNVATATVSVTAVNDAPDLAPVSDQTIELGQPLSVVVSASDSDGDNITFILDRDDPNANVPADAAIADNGDGTATITWTANALGTFEFVVLAIDDAQNALSDRESFSVVVTAPPVPFEIDLSGLGNGSPFEASFAEDQGPVNVVSTNATIDLPDGLTLTSLTVSISNLLDGNAESLSANVAGTSISQSFDAATGELQLTGVDSAANYQQVLRSIQYSNTAQSPDETDRTIRFTFSDGVSSASANTSVSVSNVNDGPDLILPAPFDDETQPFAASLNQAITFNATVVDPDDTEVTYILDLDNSGISANAVQPAISDKGAFSWTPSEAGTFEITVLATDSVGGTDSETFTVEVVETANQFSIVIDDGTELRSTNENVILSGQVDGIAAGLIQTLEIRIDNGDAVPVTFDADGRFRFETALVLDGTSDGSHFAVIEATDTAGRASRAQVVTWTIDTVGPQVTSSADGALQLAPSSVELTFDEPINAAAFDAESYQLQQVSGAGSPEVIALSSVEEVNERTVRLNLNSAVDNASFQLTLLPAITDLAGNAPQTVQFNFSVEQAARVSETSPSAGEEMVALTRETIVRFDREVDPATVTPDSFFLIANSQPVPGNIRVSSTERFATFFYDEPLPASTEVRIVVDGDKIIGRDGLPLDADNDGESGGILQADFRTLPITNIPGTSVFGYVFDSYNQDDQGNDIPIVGATISLDANSNINAVTDENGFFELGLQDLNNDGDPDGLPAPEFFVHIDGSTAINAPDGTTYATLGKPFQSVPGQRIQLELEGGPDVDPTTPGEQFDIYLPPVATGDIVDLSPTEDTVVSLGPAAQEQIRAQFADDPATAQLVIDTLQVTYPAGSAQDENGTPATQATIIPVDPERLPAPLPTGVDPRLVVSIQAGTDAGFNLAGGSTNFDEPAPVTFPNLSGASPGDSAAILSFDHDAGEWVTVGTATVSSDGESVQSDAGSGVLAPGWHIIDFLVDVFGHAECISEIPDLSNQFQSLALNTLSGLISGIDAILPIPGLDFVPNVVSTLLSAEADRLSGGGPSWQTTSQITLATIDASTLGLSSVATDWIALSIAMESWTEQANRTLDSFLQYRGEIEECVNNLGPPFQSIMDQIDNVVDWVDDQLEPVQEIRDTVDRLQDFFERIRNNNPNSPADPIEVTNLRNIIDALMNGFESFDGDGTDVLSDLFRENTTVPLLQIQADLIEFQEELEETIQGAAGAFYSISSGGSIIASGRTSSAGRWSAQLRENTSFSVSYFSSASLNSGVSTFRTGRGGGSLSLSFEVSTPEAANAENDLDSDGLTQLAEETIGTSPTLADTDGDGITDLAEIEQGTDPLGGLAFPTGIIASLDLLGPAKAVDIAGFANDANTRIAVAATGTNGIAVVDASQFDQPIILGQLDLNGDAQDVAIDGLSSTAVVAAGEGGLHFVDVSDPMIPTLTRTASGNVRAVEIIDGVAYAAVGARIISYDVVSGELLVSTNIPDGAAITDLAHDGDILYSMDANGMLRAFRVQGFQLPQIGSVEVPQAAGQLFVTGGVAYAAAINSFDRGGFSTVDVSNPAAMTVISGSDVVSPFVGPGTAIVANGSGLGLLVGSAGGQHMIDLVNLSDPENTNDFTTRFDLASAPFDAAIASGIGFIAGGTSGLHVVNYVGFDNQGNAPTVTIAGPDGEEIQEGSIAPIRVEVTDDVQVRDVELLMDGVVVARDVSAPFDLQAVTPSLASGATEVSFQVRATDTGGNVGLSDTITYTLTPDITPPVLINSTPADTSAGFRVRAVTLRFDEPIGSTALALSAFTLTDLGSNFQLGGGDDATIALDRVEVLSPRRVVVYTTEELGEGLFQLDVDPTIISDVAGNVLTDPISINFTSFDLDAENSVAWISDADGDWNNPGNWSTGEVPGPNDAVIIDRQTANPTITISEGDIQVRSLISRDSFAITGGSFTVSEASEIQGNFMMTGGTLVADGPNAIFIGGGATELTGGSLTAIAGGRISLPGATTYIHDIGTIQDEVFFRATGVGSVLDLGSLQTITNGDGSSDRIRIDALNGGVINLSNVTQIIDPNVGNTFGRSVAVNSDGVGSQINLSSLVNFNDVSASGGQSSLTTQNGGTLDIPSLTTLDGVSLNIGQANSFSVDQITSFTDGVIRVTGGDHTFTNLANGTGTRFELTGGTMNLPALTQINGASFDVSGGRTLTLPANVTAYIHDIGTIQDEVFFRATGVGSVLDLGSLQTITNGDGSSDRIRIDALNGGVINLSNVTQIIDPNVGNTFGRSVAVNSIGVGSQIDLSSLVNFNDVSASGGQSSIVADTGGVVTLNGGTTLDGVTTSETNGGMIIGNLGLPITGPLALVTSSASLDTDELALGRSDTEGVVDLLAVSLFEMDYVVGFDFEAGGPMVVAENLQLAVISSETHAADNLDEVFASEIELEFVN